MTHGSCMGSPSGFGPVGIRIQDCSLTALELRLVSALGSAFLADLAGVGTIGDLTGITTMSFTTTTLTYPTAESSLITTPSIASARTSIMVADFRVEALAEIRGSMAQPRSMGLLLRSTDLRRRMFSPAVIPAPSAALIME